MAGDTAAGLACHARGGPYSPYEDEDAAELYCIDAGWMCMDGGDADCDIGREAVVCGLSAGLYIDPGEEVSDMPFLDILGGGAAPGLGEAAVSGTGAEARSGISDLYGAIAETGAPHAI